MRSIRSSRGTSQTSASCWSTASRIAKLFGSSKAASSPRRVGRSRPWSSRTSRTTSGSICMCTLRMLAQGESPPDRERDAARPEPCARRAIARVPSAVTTGTKGVQRGQRGEWRIPPDACKTRASPQTTNIPIAAANIKAVVRATRATLQRELGYVLNLAARALAALSQDVKSGRWPDVRITLVYTGTNDRAMQPHAVVLERDGSVRPAPPSATPLP